MKIEPQYQSLYNWDFEDLDSYILIKIKIIEGFLLNSLNLILNEDKSSIIFKYDEIHPPIIAGLLFNSIKDYKLEFTNENIELKLFKKKKDIEKWPFLIKDTDINLKMIDPFSSYILFMTASENQDPQIIEVGLQFLDISISFGYVPSLITGYSLLINNPSTIENALNLIIEAADIYNNHLACYQLGLYYLIHGNNLKNEEAFKYFEKSSENSKFFLSKSLMSSLLNPLSKNCLKNPNIELSLKLIQEVLNIQNDEPIVLHEYAKYLFYGIGVEKNINKALELQKKALELNNETPNLESYEEIYKDLFKNKSKINISKITIIFGTLIATSFFFYNIYKKINKK